MSAKPSLRSGLTLIFVLFLLAACGSPGPANETGATAEPGTRADWERFETEVFAIYLPETFEGGSEQAELEQVIADLRAGGQDGLADDIATRPTSSVFYAVDTNILDAYSIDTTLTIFSDQQAAFTVWTLGDYVEWYLSVLSQDPNLTMMDSRDLVIAGYEGHLFVEKIDLGSGKAVVADEYAFKIDDIVWSFIYSTDVTEYETRHPDFEASVMSFVFAQ